MDDISKKKQGFEQRFGIEVALATAKQRFVNRLFNLIDEGFLGFTTKHCHLQEYEWAFKYVAYCRPSAIMGHKRGYGNRTVGGGVSSV